MLEVIEISCSLAGRQVLAGVTLAVEDGELFVLIGPSGSGKTTLLRVIAGLTPPGAGSVRIGGTEVGHLPPGRRGVAMVFQEDALYRHLNVAGNVEFPLRVAGLPKEVTHRRSEEEARRTGILRLLRSAPNTLSAGQRSLVATARALVKEAPVLLLDEPLARVDADARLRLRAELRRLHTELGVTTLLCTNDQVEAMALGDRLGVLDGGRLQQVGTPRELYERPANVMVAGFLGRMNLLPATTEPGWIQIGHDRLRWSGPVLEGPLLAGLRPEHLHQAGAGEPFDNCLHVVAGRVEELGSHTVLLFGLGTEGIGFSARLPAGWRRSPGDAVELAIDLERVRLFDARTGKALGE